MKMHDRRGEKNPKAKLDRERVLAIRARAKAGERPKALAREFGVTPGAINAIVRRRNWKHV